MAASGARRSSSVQPHVHIHNYGSGARQRKPCCYRMPECCWRSLKLSVYTYLIVEKRGIYLQFVPFLGINATNNALRQTVYAFKDAKIIENVIIIQVLSPRRGSTLPCVHHCHVPSLLSPRAVTSCVFLFARAGAAPPSPLVRAPTGPCVARHPDVV
jgi:hypothetical protein